MDSGNVVIDADAQWKDEVKAIVCEILELEPAEVTDTSLFKEDHDADSLLAIEILAALERRLRITIAQEELAKMVNLREVYQVVAVALASK